MSKEGMKEKGAEIWSNHKALCITAAYLLLLITVFAWRDGGVGFGETMMVRTTAYTHTESDHLVHGNKSAAGTPLKSGSLTSAAADWGFLPMGTKFKIAGKRGAYVVDDYGGALVGTETIDLYKTSKEAMNDWGVKEVEIKIVKRGDVAESIKILEGRKESSTAQRMLARLRANSER